MDSFVYFPAVVYRDERPDLVEKILPICIKHLDNVRNIQQGPMCQSMPLENEPEFKEIKNYILSSSIDLLKNQGYDVGKYDFYISGLWAQEINRGGGTNVHVHKNSQICGWFFLEAEVNGSYPIYHDPRANKLMVELDFIQGEEITMATNMIYFNNMVPGTAMFSNSWMQHQLSGNNSNTTTRCIHFIVSHKERSCNTH